MISSFVYTAIISYLLVNCFAFVTYGFDKYSASSDGWRVPERWLLFLALLGPFGAFGAMQIFRHKTRKVAFYLVPFFVFLHIAGVIYLVEIMGPFPW